MAGHSAFKNIMHKKGRKDAARAKMFTKIAREITVAAKSGLPDPTMNPRLRLAIQAARAENMPKDNIERAIKKGTGELEGADYTEVLYEAYGPGGVAIMIQAVTDNPTRTVADVRHKLSRNGGNMGTSNSVAFMFDRKGQMTVPADGVNEDALIEAALEAGADDVSNEGEVFVITTEPASLHAVKEGLESKKYTIDDAELAWVPKNTVKVEGENATNLLKLLEALEELDDVQKVDANFEMDESAMAGA